MNNEWENQEPPKSPYPRLRCPAAYMSHSASGFRQLAGCDLRQRAASILMEADINCGAIIRNPSSCAMTSRTERVWLHAY